MIAKVHFNDAASGSLAKKELRKSYCSGAQASALYSANWSLVSCAFCKDKYATVTNLRTKRKLEARLAEARKTLAAKEQRVQESVDDTHEASVQARQQALTTAQAAVASLEARLRACQNALDQLPAAGAPDHEEA